MPLATPSEAALDKQINDASNRLEIVIEQYNAVSATLAATKAREAAVAKELVPLQAAVDAARGRVADIAARAYEATPLFGLAMVIDTQSTTETVERLTMLDGISLTRQSQFDTYDTASQAYRFQQQTLATLDRQQTSQQAVLATEKATILSQIAKLKSLRSAAFGPSGVDASARTSNYVPAYSAGAAGRAVRFAYNQIGKPYQWAAAGPNSYDCSGLTMAAWRQGGVSLPHNAAQQYSVVAHISRSALKSGDLIFYYSPIHHVAIYIGGGNVIEAPRTGETVKIAPVDIGPIAGYGRPG